MPRIFMSVLAGRRRRAVGRDRAPTRRLPPLRTAGGPRKGWQQNEVDDGQQGVADETSDGGRNPQIAIPESPAARTPDVMSLALRCEAAELLVAVVHVEDFVAQDLLEDRARRRVIVDALLIDRKASGRSLFRD